MLRTKPVSSSLDVYQHIRDLVLYRDLDTQKRFPVKKVARQLGISETPIYSALRKLEGEGFLENVENSGHFVIPLTEERLTALYERIERSICWSLRKGLSVIDECIIAELRQTLVTFQTAPPDDYRELARHIGDLCSTMAAPCGNRELRAGAQYVNDHLRFPRSTALRYFTDFVPGVIATVELFLETIEGGCQRRSVVATLRGVSAQVDRERGYARTLGNIIMLRDVPIH